MAISRKLSSELGFPPQRKNNNVNAIDFDTDDENQVNDEEMQPLPPTCGICTLPMSAGDVFNNSDRCMHPPYYCRNCISLYLVDRIRFVTVQNVPCPDLNCTAMLDPMAFKILLPEDLFDTWLDITVESALPPMKYQCRCPFCSELVINECKDKSVRKVECPNCKKEVCFKCQVPWHHGRSCYNGMNDNDVKFAKLAHKKKWRKCPHCSYWVERVNGCKSIHCRCGFYFCYKCGKDHNGYHRCSLLTKIWNPLKRKFQKWRFYWLQHPRFVN